MNLDKDGTLLPPKVEVMNPEIPGFKKGINLGNGFDAPPTEDWGVVIEENHFKYAKEAGMDHVRLPVRFSAYAKMTAPYTIDEEFFAKIDWALDMAEKYKLSILLDLHHYNELMTDPAANRDRFLGLWKQISERYKDRPATVAFELLNEPSDKLVPELLDPLMKEAFTIVRATNPTRLVFIDSYFWSSTEWLDRVDTSYMDDNSVVTFHMYQPILFTHQQASWMPPEFGTKGIVFPGPPEKPVEISDAAYKAEWVANWLQLYNTLPAAENPCGPKTIYEEFDRATAFVKKSGIRTYLGEFGAIDFADEGSRLRFLTMVREESERRGIGWCYWDDGGNNKGLDVKTGTWVDVVQKALFN
jgi:endoglucanase